jgi:hypothetical protein
MVSEVSDVKRTQVLEAEALSDAPLSASWRVLISDTSEMFKAQQE